MRLTLFVLPILETTAIARRRPKPQQRDTTKRLRINDQIRVSPVRLIDDENEQAGVVELDVAKRMAKEANLDLVEVSPNTTPPVCRVMDYGKWKYQQKKKEQKARSHATKSELKGVRLRPKIDKHDLEIKMVKAREFLDDSNKVQFTMLFRGREMAHRDLGLQTMRNICDSLADISKVESPPRMMGRRATMVLAPEKGTNTAKGKAKPEAPKAESPSEPVESDAPAPPKAASA